MGGNKSEQLLSAIFLDDNSIIVSGRTSSDSIGGFVYANHGLQYIFLARLKNQEISIKSENSSHELSVFPNPVSDIFYIDGDETIGAKYAIFSIEGKMTLSHNYTDGISVNTLPNGIYFLKIYLKTSTAYKKFIKNNLFFIKGYWFQPIL